MILCGHVSHMLQSKQDTENFLSRYLKLSQNTKKIIFSEILFYTYSTKDQADMRTIKR